MAEIEQTKIDALKDGLNQALAKIEQAMALQVYAEKLPLVGAGLKTAFDQGSAWVKSITTLKENIFAALDAIDTAAERLDTAVSSAISAAISNAGFIGSSLSATVNNGGDLAFSLTTNKFVSGSISLASDLGIPGVGIETTGTATATLGYAINLSAGVDSNGFYVSTDQANEIQSSLTISGSDISANAEWGFLNFNATDVGSYLSAQLSIDLKDADGKIRLTDLDNDLLDATINGASHIEIALSADASSQLLPSVSATLVVDWAFDVGTTVNPNDDNTGFGQTPQVKVKDVHLDLGSFMTDFVQPALAQLEPILKPIHQVLTVLNSEVKVLKSMPNWQTLFDKTGDGKITFLDLIKLAAPSADLTSLNKFIDLADKVLDWADFLSSANFSAESYSVGDFTINGDVRALSFKIGESTTTFGGFVEDLGDLVGGLEGTGWSGTSAGGQTGQQIFEAIVEGGDFSLPILTDPNQIIKLILGGNADLMEIELPDVDLMFNNPNMLSFSIFPGIDVKLGGGVGLGFDLAFGYDTRGLLQTGTAIDGFYIIDGSGPEVTFSASITLGVALDAFIASLYGGGDITGTVDFDLADDIGSTPGRIYVDEMAALLSSNPFQIFDTSGKITGGFTAYATVFWGEVWRHTSPRVTLGSFSFDNPATSDATTPVVLPDLGVKDGFDLLINIGDRASLRNVTDKTDGSESIEIGTGTGGVTVFGFGEQQAFSGITKIIAAGGLLGDQIVMGDDVSGVRAEFYGGAGEDVLVGGAVGDKLDGGAERDYLEGNGGDDELLGGAGDDILVGGAGADTINGGDGSDIVSYFNSATAVVINLATGVNTGGDAAGDTISNVEIVEGSGYDDTITGGGVAHTLAGLGGNDTITGTDGNDVLIGNAGNDILNGLAGQDILIGGLGDDTYYVDDLGDDVQENRMQEIAANVNGGTDLIYASLNYTLDVTDRQDIENLTLLGAARIGTGNALANILTGTTGDDTLNGLGGADELHGGAGKDTLNGGDQADELYGEAGDDTLDGGTGADEMAGGADNDAYLVDNAGDIIVEAVDEGADTVKASVNYVLTAGAHVEALSTSNDDGTTTLDLTGNEFAQIITGDKGNNTLEGRGGADIFVGGAGTDIVTYRGSSVGVTIDRNLVSQAGGEAAGDIIGSDIEIIEGSTKSDVFRGTNQADHFRGLAGNDTFYGNGGDDRMVGGAGNDTYYVDSLNDIVDETSASSGAGRDKINSSINYSLIGNDEVEDLSLSGSARIGTGNWQSNRIEGTSGADTLDGKQGSDTLVGKAGNDHYWFDSAGDVVEELVNEGTDTIHIATTDFITPTQQNPDPLVTFSLNTSWGANVENVTVEDSVRRVDITGNALSNTLIGNNRNNTLTGLGGADRLVIGHGRDIVDGGEGADTLVLDWSSIGDGMETFNLSKANDGTGYSGNIYRTYYGDASNLNRVDFAGIDHFELTLGSGGDVIRTGDGNDRVIGNAGSDYINTGAGVDVVDGGNEADGSTGADRWEADKSAATLAMVINLTASSSTYTIGSLTGSVTRIEALTLKTGSGNDTITTRRDFLEDVIDTGGGDDTVKIAGGRDTVTMGAGTDTLILDWSNIGDGMETFSLTKTAGIGYSGSIFRTYYGDASNLNRVDFSGVDHFDLTLGSGGDVIRTGDGNDRVIGNVGNDYINTGAGVDVVDGGNEADGSSGIDRWEADKSAATLAMVINLTASSSSYTIGSLTGSVTRIEALTLKTGSGGDTITTRGNFLEDVIDTGGGADTVKIAGGRDTVTMGAGTDTLIIDWSTIGESMEIFSLTAALDGTGYSGNIYRTYYGDHSGLNRADFSGVDKFDITFGSGDDIIRTGNGDDKVSGGAGNDWLETGGGADVVNGGAGIDRWIADRSGITDDLSADLTDPSAIVNYTLNGRAGSFTGIEMLTFVSGSGDDTIITRGEFYSDTISTSGGDDTIKIAGGRDTVNGGTGSDTLVVDWGSIGDGMEVFDLTKTDGLGYSGSISRHYYGDHSSLNRVDFSGIEHFDMTFGSAADVIRTGDGNDRIIGNAGSDYINTGKGADIVDGGNETDGSTGADRWEADKSAATVAMTINLTAASSTYKIGSLTGSVTRIEALTLKTGSGSDIITTRGDFLTDIITTAAGNDTVKVAGGRDSVDMGIGTDTLIIDWSAIGESMEIAGLTKASDGTGYSGAIYRAYYGDASNLNRADFAGVDKFDITFGSGHDIIRTGDGDDKVSSGAGDDLLDTGTSADIVIGGVGNDRWKADKSAATSNISIDLTDTTKVTSYSVSGRTGSLTGIEMLTLTTGSGNDTITTRGEFFEDQITTGAGDDRIKIAGGRDYVDGGTGSDTLVIDWSGIGDAMEIFSLSKTVDGNGYSGAIFRTYYGDATNLNRADFAGIDHFDLTFGSGGDIIRTGDGDDRVLGGAGNDYINTGKGVDVVDGGSETDGSRGADRWEADKSDATLGMTINLNASSSTYEIGGETGSVKRIEALTLTTGSGGDTITTRSDFLSDVIDTGGGNDTVKIAGGRDTVTMGTGTDTLVIDWSNIADSMEVAGLTKTAGLGHSGAIYRTYYGDSGGLNRLDFSGVDKFDVTFGSGNDIVVTGDGADRLAGGAGNDTLTGGGGSDTFVYTGGKDTITDFQVGVDKLTGSGFDAIKSLAQLMTMVDKTNLVNTVVTLSADNVLTLSGINWQSLAGSSFTNAAPTITSYSSASSVARTIAENSTAVLATVSATDPETHAISYSLSGADAALFSVDAATGALKFKSGANFENPADANEDNVYSVTVKAVDGFGASDSQSFNITVTNVAEAPVISSNGGGSTAAISVVENGTAITTVIAADDDAGSTLTYTLSGDDASLFNFDAATGKLAFKSAPNFESPTDTGANNIYNLAIEVKDNTGRTDKQTLTVTVTNQNETPVLTSNGGGSSATISLAENGTAVTTVIAADVDAGAKLSYAISGTDAALFSIDKNTGKLAFKSAPDFETPADSGANNTYNLIVSATDEKGLSDTQSLAVKITDVKGLVYNGTSGDDTKSGTVEVDTLKGGSAGIDRLNGLAGDDILDGGTGSDFLNGGDGRDLFIFSTTLGSSNVDTLESFSLADDTIQLNKSIFKALSGTALTADQFVKNIDGVAIDEKDRIVYDTSDGRLYYDADGSKAGKAVLFAILDTKPSITELDFALL